MRGLCGDRSIARWNAATASSRSLRCSWMMPERPVGRREVRVQLDRVVALLERRLEVAPVDVDHREIARDDRRHRIERLRDAASPRAPRRGGPSAPGTTSRTSGARSRSADRGRSRSWNSRSAPRQSQSCVAFTCASDVCASARIAVEHHRGRRARRRLRPHLRRLPARRSARAGCTRRPGRCARARTARPRRSPSRRTRPPCAALRRSADSGDSAPAGRGCARPGSPPAGARRAAGRRRAGRGSSLLTTASATASCAAKTSPSARVDRLRPQVRRRSRCRSRCDRDAQPIAGLAHAAGQQHRGAAGVRRRARSALRRRRARHGEHAQRFELAPGGG